MKHANIATITNGGPSLGHYRVGPTSYGSFPGGWSETSRLLRVIRTWLDRRRQRQALGMLNEHMLKDIGITRIDAAHEIEKPFWRS